MDKRYRIGLPKSLCEVLEWKKRDKLKVRLVNLELVQKLLSGEIDLENGKMPIMIFNLEKKKDAKPIKKARTIFD